MLEQSPLKKLAANNYSARYQKNNEYNKSDIQRQLRVSINTNNTPKIRGNIFERVSRSHHIHYKPDEV